MWARSSAWLERTPDKREVGCSSQPGPTSSADGLVPRAAGGVAQLGEHLLCTQGVSGSSPLVSTAAVRHGRERTLVH